MRMARRFYANTEKYSWNLTSGSPAAQYVTHDVAPAPSKDGLNELAYKSYAKFSRGLGITPITFSAWSRVVDKVSAPDDYVAKAEFHGHDGDLRIELQDHLTARSRGIPVAPMYDQRRNKLRRDGRQVMATGGGE